jgi:hypothetical protein
MEFRWFGRIISGIQEFQIKHPYFLRHGTAERGSDAEKDIISTSFSGDCQSDRRAEKMRPEGFFRLGIEPPRLLRIPPPE